MSVLIKYPRTFHLPWSGSVSSDDKIVTADTLAWFKSGVELRVTEKLDGGNVSLLRNDFYSRSTDARSQPWDHYAKTVWAGVRHLIPEGWRISAESLHARRSVAYDNLPGPLMVFGVWDDKNNAVDWDTVVSMAEMLGLPVVPVLYSGNDFNAACNAWSQQLNEDISEGYVVRSADSFAAELFQQRVAKWVRPNHVRTSDDFRKRDDYQLNGYALKK